MEEFIKTNQKMTNDNFQNVANLLLNNTVLQIRDIKYRISDIEIHHKKTDKKPNLLNFRSLENYGNWQFMSFNSTKQITNRGLYLRLDDEKDNMYYEILIRAIYNERLEDFIEGPRKVLNKILKEYEINNIKKFTNGKILNSCFNERDLIIVDSIKTFGEKIFNGPILKVFDKNKIPFHRFAIFKDKIKQKNLTLIEYKVVSNVPHRRLNPRLM
jgi:hypothetical protein